MKLKSFGCSFIFGSDLADTPHGTHIASKHTWPALIAEKLGYEYECHARPGSGNLQITDRILDQIAVSDSSDLFVIGWSWIDRFDFYDPNNNGQEWYDWITLLPSDPTQAAQVYYRDLHSEYRDKLTSLMSVQLIISMLKQKGIPFIMTYMDDLILDDRWNVSAGMKELQSNIKKDLLDFEGQSFLSWSRDCGYPESAGWHPLEQAHRAAANHIIKVFDKQKTTDQAQ